MRTLVIGLGSPHGDDQVGWRVAEMLSRCVGGNVRVRLSGAPSQLWDCLDEDELLIVCDACHIDTIPPGSILRWDWPATEVARTSFSGSHDFPLPEVLELASVIGSLPPRVTLWGVVSGTSQFPGDLSPAVAAALPEVVDCISRQISGHLRPA